MSELKAKAKRLGFRGMVARWEEYANQTWVKKLLEEEMAERESLSLARRVREAKIGQFKPLAEFDWSWPTTVDRELVEGLFNFKFLEEGANVVLVGTNGLGKTMVAQNLVYQALIAGHDARFIKASQLLTELADCDGAYARKRRLNKYSKVDLLAIDEVGYLSYDNHYADLLYEVITGRYPKLSTIITTNRSFEEWGQIFPNAACVVTLVDRLMHKAEMVVIEGESYRHKEAKERAEAREKQRKEKKTKKKQKDDTSGGR